VSHDWVRRILVCLILPYQRAYDLVHSVAIRALVQPESKGERAERVYGCRAQTLMDAYFTAFKLDLCSLKYFACPPGAYTDTLSSTGYSL